jgi:hypothetical protein
MKKFNSEIRSLFRQWHDANARGEAFEMALIYRELRDANFTNSIEVFMSAPYQCQIARRRFQEMHEAVKYLDNEKSLLE